MTITSLSSAPDSTHSVVQSHMNPLLPRPPTVEVLNVSAERVDQRQEREESITVIEQMVSDVHVDTHEEVYASPIANRKRADSKDDEFDGDSSRQSSSRDSSVESKRRSVRKRKKKRVYSPSDNDASTFGAGTEDDGAK